MVFILIYKHYEKYYFLAEVTYLGSAESVNVWENTLVPPLANSLFNIEQF